MRRERQKTQGFTLIELLVVIAIIGLLAAIIYPAINTVRAKARDAKRVAALRQYTIALELFYDEYGKYPCGDGVFNYPTTPIIRVGIDGPGDGEFLNGDPSGGTNGDNPPNGCPDAISEADTAGNPRTGLKTESFYNESLPNGITGDPFESSGYPFKYVYWVAKDRQSYIMTARLEQNDSRMGSDGGKCDGRYEVGPGLSKIISNLSAPFDYWYNNDQSGVECGYEALGICAPSAGCGPI